MAKRQLPHQCNFTESSKMFFHKIMRHCFHCKSIRLVPLWCNSQLAYKHFLFSNIQFFRQKLLCINYWRRIFLVADTQLCKRLYPSVRPLVHPPVRGDRVDKWKNVHFWDFLWMFVCGVEGWGVDGGWKPLPTRPQRYCDPASLVCHCLQSYLLDKSIYNTFIDFFLFLR